MAAIYNDQQKGVGRPLVIRYQKLPHQSFNRHFWCNLGTIALSISLPQLIPQGFLGLPVAIQNFSNLLQTVHPMVWMLSVVLLVALPLNIAHRLRCHPLTLPAAIAPDLQPISHPIAYSYDQVTVMFADLVGFTPLSAQMAPDQLFELLNLIFSTFDQLVDHHQLETIKTVGDAYMVAGGLPGTPEQHADAMVALALDMQEAIAQIRQITGKNLYLRIGIHTGPVVAGVIGLKKLSYDLWGDTVNIASRMESQGIVGGIQMSEHTYQLLQGSYGVRSLGCKEIKGKGEMQTYTVNPYV